MPSVIGRDSKIGTSHRRLTVASIRRGGCPVNRAKFWRACLVLARPVTRYELQLDPGRTSARIVFTNQQNPCPYVPILIAFGSGDAGLHRPTFQRALSHEAESERGFHRTWSDTSHQLTCWTAALTVVWSSNWSASEDRVK